MARKQAKNPTTPIILMILGSVIILGVVIWQTIKALGPEIPAAQPGPVPTSEIPFPEVARISLQDAKSAHDDGSAVFVDVRDPEYYSAGHVSGALNIPYSKVRSRMAELDKNQWIITYCT
ncbi:MAG: rhodanese-like domain-containing protein [Bellilinea sp.]